MKLQIKDSGACPAHPLAAVVPPDWKQFVEACAEGENCTVNISAIARRAKKLLGGAGSGLVQFVALPDGWKPVPVEPTEAMVLAPGALHTSGRHARIHRDVWSRMLAAAPAPPAAQEYATQTASIAHTIVLAVAELDRDSPEDQPEMMLVTTDELRAICIAALAAKRTGQ